MLSEGTSAFFPLFIYTSIHLFIFLAALGLTIAAHRFSLVAEVRLSLVAMQGLLIAVACLVTEHEL